MAVAQSDGSIILSTKIDTKGVTAGLNDVKTRIGKAASAIGAALTTLKDKRETVAILSQAIKDQTSLIDRLNYKYAELVVKKGYDSSETKKLKKEIDSLNSELREMQISLEDIGNNKYRKQIKGLSDNFANLGKRFSGIVKSALVFSVVYRAVQKLVEIVKNVAMGNEEFKKSVEELQSALWIAITPILNVVIPALHTLVQWLTQAVLWVGKFFAAISGKSYMSLVDNSKALRQQADNYKKLSKNAKDAKKSLAGFDDIMILDDNSAEQTGGNIPTQDMNLAQSVDPMLSTLMGIIGGALLALGVLLLFFGQIGWGIGFIIAGAAMVGVTSVAIADSDLGIEAKFASIMAVVGFFIFAIGLILLLKVPTAQPLALGMMIAGAGILAVGAVQLAANELGGEIETMLHGILAIVSGALLAIGIIMLFSGQITPLSIGLVVTGAVGLASELALNFDAVKTALEGWVGGITAIVSGLALIIGIIMLCTGHITPLSIGLVVAGAVGLAATLAVNWDTVITALQGWVGEVVAIVSGALLVLGIILVACGVLPLGIALIVAGAAGLVTVVAINKDMLVAWFKGLWDSVKEFWNTHIAPIFTKEWWLNLAKKAGNGILSGFEGAINGVIGMFESMINWIVDKLNKLSFDVPDWVPGIGGKTFGFNLQKVKFDRVKIPRLAQGAVIPANREFLAVLGDQKQGVNIEAPLQTIVDAFNIALANGGGGNSGNTTVVLEIDGREFGHAVIEQGQRESRRLGTRLVMA